MKNAMKETNFEDLYIFRWLTNQFDNMSKNNRILSEFSEEVVQFIPDLVKK